MRDFLKGVFGNKGCWGASAATPSNSRLLLRSSRAKVLQGSVHSRVVRRLREFQGRTSRFKLKIQIQEMPSYISGDPAHGPSCVLSREAKADIKGKWSVR